MSKRIKVIFDEDGASVSWESVESETPFAGSEWFDWCMIEIEKLLKPAFPD